MADQKSYSAENIKVLEGLEGVRHRPSMYIGNTGKSGLHHLVYEVVDNSVDEAMGGYCDKIEVTLNKDGSVTVSDNGRGIPIENHPVYKVPAVEIVVTKLHAGGKFDKDSYKVSGGLHGVGISVVAALSKLMRVTIKRGGKKYQQEYEIGKPLYKLKTIGDCDKDDKGTEVTFWPDEKIFSALKFDFSVLETRFREIAFLNKGLKIVLEDTASGRKEVFHYEGGLVEFVKWVNETKEPLHKPVYFIKEDSKYVVECAVQYNNGYQENILSFVNTINTVEGGTHVAGFRTALTRAINDYAKKNKLAKEDSLTGDDVREGLTVILSIKVPEPQFEGQTKTKLGNSDVKGIVDKIASSSLSEFFEENPAIAKRIVAKAMEAQKAREAAKKAKDLVRRKSAFSVGGLPGKLKDCASKKTEDSELFIVEGDSAGGSASQGRNKEYQAILPLKGKILNVEKANVAKVFSSEEIANLITALGTGVGEQFNLEKIRYGKVVIMSVDGEEASFIQHPNGQISFVKVGEFIDGIIEHNIDPSIYKVLCFSLKQRRTQFKKIKSVIRHPIEDKLYEIKTAYGRNVKITSSHSIFVYENNEIKLKKGDELKVGDKIVAPKNTPLSSYISPNKIDLLSLFVRNKSFLKGKMYVRGKSVEFLARHKIRMEHMENDELTGQRVAISPALREKMKNIRKERKLSQSDICSRVGIKQPCVYYAWEKGESRPTLRKFDKYIETLGIDMENSVDCVTPRENSPDRDFGTKSNKTNQNLCKNNVQSQIQLMDSSLDRVWKQNYCNSGRNKVKDYMELSQINEEDLLMLDNDITICAEHYKSKGLSRFVPINNSLFKLLGFWVAEGSCSLRNGVRLSIGNNDGHLLGELSEAFMGVFGIHAKHSTSSDRPSCSELKLVNKVAALFWNILFNSRQHESTTKRIPDLVFNISKEAQLEFLRTYFLGDGTISKHGLSFTTTSKDLANQLVYLISSHNIMAGISTRAPSSNNLVSSKSLVYSVSITSREDIIYLKRIWEDHHNACHLNSKLSSKWPSINKAFEPISEDLVGLKVKSVQEITSTSGQVYDFSVEDDENFIAGMGGLCCHNTDADVDGAHIRTLLLTFFYRFMKPVIENGHLYIAVSPLYKVRKRGDHYVYSDEELKSLLKEIGSGALVQRFKGLGEMNPEQLWETTMNPKDRLLKRVMIEDAVDADRVFSILMGSEVEPRKKFIVEKAHEAQVDI